MAPRQHAPPWRDASGREMAWLRNRSGTVAHPRWTARARHSFLNPSWKSLPVVLALVCVAGALPGPPLALFFGWLLDIHWEEIFARPEMLNRFAWLGGACQGLC